MVGLTEAWLIGLTVGVGVLGVLQVLAMIPRPYRVRSWLGGHVIEHEHEYGHNPGDGYFYCTLEDCHARKRLGGM